MIRSEALIISDVWPPDPVRLLTMVKSVSAGGPLCTYRAAVRVAASALGFFCSAQPASAIQFAKRAARRAMRPGVRRPNALPNVMGKESGRKYGEEQRQDHQEDGETRGEGDETCIGVFLNFAVHGAVFMFSHDGSFYSRMFFAEYWISNCLSPRHWRAGGQKPGAATNPPPLLPCARHAQQPLPVGSGWHIWVCAESNSACPAAG